MRFMGQIDQTLIQQSTSQEISNQAPEQIATTPRPWGFWTMLGFSFLFHITFFVSSIIILMAAFLIARMHNPGLQLEVFYPFGNSGLFLSIVTIVSGFIIVGLSILFASLSKIPVNEYLCLRKANLKQYCFWLIILIIFGSLHSILKQLLDRPAIPQEMLDIYNSAGFVPLLLFSIVIISPITEEVFFRGFLFTSFKYSKAGIVGAVILTSFLWTVGHQGYDLVDLIGVFLGGVLLCLARIKTQSLYVPLAMHFLMNLIAMVELILFKHHIVS